ncbi:MAG: sodium-dependent transporter [Planctomycetota bacterium]|jgi:NSS family neurotransmitter:Na+ symporter
MPELLEEQRESWGTRGGFVLAAVGSAVGLGNLWRFPYELYGHGGGAFLIPYIIAVFVIGVPMLILEFSLGHLTQRAAPDAFGHSNRKFEFVGWWSILLGFVIVTFYTVILAYCFSFLWFSIEGIVTGGQLPWAGEGVEGVRKAEEFFYDTYLGKSEGWRLGAIRWNIFGPLVITWVVMYFCIFRGVKLVGKIVWWTVPLPWLMLAILTVRGLTLEGSVEGLAYYLNPDWSELLKATTWRFAFGQAFFSLSLAFGGVMITYASFLHRKSDLNNNAAIIALADFGTSFVAGLAVFATLGGMAFVTRQAGHTVAVENVVKGGAGLAFVAFPYALAQLPHSAWFSLIFFFALVTLGIDSAFSLTESVLAAVVDKTGWRRSIVLPVVSVVGLVLGMVFITQGGLNWLGVIGDFIDGTWGIAFLGLVECLVLGWLWRIDRLRRHANERSDWRLGKWWNYLVRIGIPIVLSSLFVWSFFDDVTQQGGFLRNGDGGWIFSNCIGLAVMILIPVSGVVISMTRGRSDLGKPRRSEAGLEVGGGTGGFLAFVLAVSSALLAAVLFRWAVLGREDRILLWLSFAPAIAAVVAGNYLADRHNGPRTRPSWFARWAGLLGTLDIGAFIALNLIYRTRQHQTELETASSVIHAREQLNVVSYFILSAVLLLIIGGLGWCFYRALLATSQAEEPQPPDEVDANQENDDTASA